MKKAQILSAIALAFALGVVAPIAGVYATAGIMPLAETGTTTEKSATTDNLKSAVNYVTSNATYKAFANLAEAKEAATGVTDVDDANTALTNALRSFTGATTTSGDTFAAMTANTNNLKNAVGTNYAKYAALYDAMNADASKIGSDAAIAGVARAMQDLGYTFNVEDTDTFNTDPSQDADHNVVAQAQALINSDDKVENWSVYSAAVKAVKDAEATTKAFNNLKGALQNDNLGLTKSQKADVSDAQTIATLDGITPADATAWDNVAKKITDIEDAIKNENGTNNTERYALLDSATDPKGLLQLMQVATDNEDLTYAELISAAPVIPTDPVTPEQPGDDNDDNKGEGDGKGDGASTPDTGVIANSEATATSTASIMAGIATALTAAGVGVVAFRNIRRNKKA